MMLRLQKLDRLAIPGESHVIELLDGDLQVVARIKVGQAPVEG